MNPPSILDRKFRYVPSGETDIRKTFARIRKQMADAERRAVEHQHEKILLIPTRQRG